MLVEFFEIVEMASESFVAVEGKSVAKKWQNRGSDQHATADRNRPCLRRDPQNEPTDPNKGPGDQEQAGTSIRCDHIKATSSQVNGPMSR